MLLQSLIHVALLALSFCHGASAFYGFSGVQDNVNTMTGQRPKRLNIDTMAAGDPILLYVLKIPNLLRVIVFEYLARNGRHDVICSN